MQNISISHSHRAFGRKCLQQCDCRSKAGAISKVMRLKSATVPNLRASSQFDRHSQIAVAAAGDNARDSHHRIKGWEKRQDSDLGGADWRSYYEEVVSEDLRTALRSAALTSLQAERRCGRVSYGLVRRGVKKGVLTESKDTLPCRHQAEASRHASKRDRMVSNRYKSAKN